MSTRAEELARQFEQANGEVINTIEQLSDVQWQAPGEDEGRTVGITAHHIAVSHSTVGGIVQALAAGQAPPVTLEAIHAANADHMKQHADCDKEETLAILRRDGEQAANMVRNLSDDELNQAGMVPFLGDNPISTAQFIEAILIGHIHAHLPGIQAAAGKVA